MAITKRTPTKKGGTRAAKPPGKRLTQDTNDYRELKVYVENGCCVLRDENGRVIKHLSATEIFEKYPQFVGYDYSSLNNVLQRFKQQKQKHAQERADYGKVDTHHGGLRQFSNLQAVSEDDDEETWADGISHISLGGDDDDAADAEDDDDFDDGASYASTVNGFRSVACRGKPRRGKPRIPKKMKIIHGLEVIALPYVQDIWDFPDAMISLQIHLLSGDNNINELLHRVSTNQDEYVLAIPFSANMLTPEAAFHSWVGEVGDDYNMVSKYLDIHPKIKSRMKSIAKLVARDPTKELYYEQRIKLAKCCLHQPTTALNGCKVFNGTKFVEFANGEIHLFVELKVDTGDNYNHQKAAASITKAKRAVPLQSPSPRKAYAAAAGIPQTVNVGGADDVEMEGDDLSQQMEDAALEPDRAARAYAQGVLQQLEEHEEQKKAAATKKKSGGRAKVLQPTPSYDGIATRSGRSLKSLKRTARHQDDVEEEDEKTGVPHTVNTDQE